VNKRQSAAGKKAGQPYELTRPLYNGTAP